MHISDEIDPLTKNVDRIIVEINNFEQRRVIDMDGPEPPSPNAPHTWQGCSSGRWEGNMLTVTTTHIKHGYHRRNGVPQSDQTTLTEHFVRHGHLLTHVSVTTDPVFLTEPLVKSQHFILNNNLHGQSLWTWPCEISIEVYEPEGPSPRDAAPVDLTGYWTAVITEDYRLRMFVPAKLDYTGIPMSVAGRDLANPWDPERDARTLQGDSTARWNGRTLEIVTRNVSMGYLRRNGVPYSEGTTIAEYFDQHTNDGQRWFTVTTVIQNPVYLRAPLYVSSDFKALPNGREWNPSPCISEWRPLREMEDTDRFD